MANDMKTSRKGVISLCAHEGIVPAPYLDSVGVWTWGVGHTAAAGDPDPATMPRAMPANTDFAIREAVRQLGKDLAKYEARVNQAITAPLKRHEFDALVSFDYNTGGIFRAKVTNAINAGEVDAARHFMGWLKPPEIRGRRTAEMRLFRTGDYDAAGDIPVWKTNGKGKLTGILRTISAREVLAMLRPVTPQKSDGLAWLKNIFKGA